MVPFIDLQAQYRSIKAEVAEAIEKTLESSQFILGPEVAEFEREFAAYCEVEYGVGVNSGTSALHLALLAAGIGAGDEVITTPFTFVATAAAICYTGARPVFVDIDPETCNMDVSRVEAAITERTKAIIPVHLYGRAVEMHPLMELARRRNLLVIEDACQAHGATYHGQRVGSFGDMACFSFYPGKNLGAYGEGGILVTRDPEWNRKVRVLRDWGQERKYYHQVKGYNYRMDGLQGAILRVKLRYLEGWTEARRAHAARYAELLDGSAVRLLAPSENGRHVYHCFIVRSEKRDELIAALHERKIHAGIHYPIPVHLQEAYADLGYGVGDFPNAEAAANEVLSLPLYPEMTAAQIETVCAAVRELTESAAAADASSAVVGAGARSGW